MRKIRPVLITVYSVSMNGQYFLGVRKYQNKYFSIDEDLVSNELLYHNTSYHIILQTTRQIKEIMYETN